MSNSYPQKTEGVCDKCSGELYTRDDDKIEAIRNRLSVYEKSTAPLIDFYTKEGKIIDVDSSQKPENVFSDLKKVLD